MLIADGYPTSLRGVAIFRPGRKPTRSPACWSGEHPPTCASFAAQAVAMADIRGGLLLLAARPAFSRGQDKSFCAIVTPVRVLER
jgi:hypothetical protein